MNDEPTPLAESTAQVTRGFKHFENGTVLSRTDAGKSGRQIHYMVVGSPHLTTKFLLRLDEFIRTMPSVNFDNAVFEAVEAKIKIVNPNYVNAYRI